MHSRESIGLGLALFALLPTACRESSGDVQQREPTTAEVVEGELVQIQETPEALIVRAAVSLDPQGGFLVAEMAENQVRRYGADGSLEWSTGRRGDGPGEYRSPVAATRLEDGRIAVLDNRGRLTTLTPDGTPDTVFTFPFSRVEGGQSLGASTLLVSGVSPTAEDPTALLHIVDIVTGEIVNSFFPLPKMASPAVASAMSYAMADVQGDTIAAAFAGFDSIYMYTTDGTHIRTFAAPLTNFRVAEHPQGNVRDPMERAKWLETFETMSGIWWIDDSRLALSYKTLIPGGVSWHWAVVSTDGILIHEESNSRELLEADDTQGTIITVHPERGPSVWQRISVR